MLQSFDGQEPPRWVDGITLNTFIAFLASLAKLALMIPVIESLGQLKWIWFASKPRALDDFQLFDQASRGGLGCIKLLIKLKGMLGCPYYFEWLLYLNADSVDGYILLRSEQESGEPECHCHESNDFLKMEWNGSRANDTLMLQQAVISNVYLPTTQLTPVIVPRCAAGNCKWDSFGTLAICSQVVNLTAQGNETLLASLGKQTVSMLDLFHRQSLIALKATTNTTAQEGTSSIVWPLAIAELESPSGALDISLTNVALADMFVAFPKDFIDITSVTNSTMLEGFEFFEFLFHWCIPALDVQVTDGISKTKVLATSTKIASPNPPHSLNRKWSPDFADCAAPMACNYTLQGETVVLAPSGTISAGERSIEYAIDVNTALAASGFIGSHLAGGTLTEPGDTIIFENGNIAYPLSVALFGSVEPQSLPPEVQLQNMQTITSNIATGITNMIREIGTTFPDSKGPALGYVYAQEQFVRIHWKWVVLIATQLVLASAFLTATIIMTKRARIQILKNSTLPMMLALNEADKSEFNEIHGIHTLNDKAKLMRVKLERCVGGVGLWLGLAKDDSSYKGSPAF
ncbi:hypothetical protein TruAng_000153 [Truncatella angustata]|nr:hypothetical protein TruAng_000153 [Truncatella angustata]